MNQVLGWVALGRAPSPSRYHQTLTTYLPRCCRSVFVSTPHSIRLNFPVRISDQTQKPALEDSLVLPRVLCLFCDTFYQCRRAVLPFVLGTVGCVD